MVKAFDRIELTYLLSKHKVSDWLASHDGDQQITEFVFVAYTRVQFCVAGPKEGGKVEEKLHRRHAKLAGNDRNTLIQYGINVSWFSQQLLLFTLHSK